jgi:effector-binding domain-containing protein
MRFRSTAADMPRGFYHRYTAMLRHLSEHGLTPASPPFAIYDNNDGNAADVEAGFVIEGDVPSSADMRVIELPGATVVALTHCGDYSNIEPSYFRLLEWMHELGLKRTGRYMETYLNSPLDTPDAELRTVLMAPVDTQSANDH